MINKNKLRGRIFTSGYNLATFADAMELNRNTICNIVNGKNQPSYFVLIQIIDTLQLTSEEFNEIFFPDCFSGCLREAAYASSK